MTISEGGSVFLSSVISNQCPNQTFSPGIENSLINAHSTPVYQVKITNL